MKQIFCDKRHNETVSAKFFLYEDGLPGLALFTEDTGEPWATASFHPGRDLIEIAADAGGIVDEETIFIKDWSENKGIETELVDAGIVCPGGPCVSVGAGYVDYSGFRLTEQAMLIVNELRAEKDIKQSRKSYCKI